MKLPQSLAKYGGQNRKLEDAEDTALVKMGTLRSMIARALHLIPIPGGGMAVRRSADGDVWTLTESAKPFQISNTGVVHPGLVGGLMPTLGGDPLDATTNKIDLTSDDKVWFQLNFSVTYVESYLGSYTLDSVSVEQGAAVPSDDADTKHLQFNTITGGRPAASFFATSIAIALCDDGISATRLEYNAPLG